MTTQPPQRATVCLCMMVRNEAQVIVRALDSVVDQIDAWAITDTGSTDGTPELVKQYFAEQGVPGVLQHAPFVDFGTSRTAAIEHALTISRGRSIDYILLLDADEIIQVRDSDWRQQLDGAAYLLGYDGPLSYRALYLVPTSRDWHFVGRTHEYLTERTDTTAPPHRHFDGISLHHHGDGGSKQDKFVRDARLLSLTLAEQPDDARSWFYLGESLLNGNIDIPAALDAYTRRTELGGFEEEAWYAAYRRGHCLEKLTDSGGDVWPAILAYLRAWERRPWRAEPVTNVVRLAAQHRLPLPGFVLGEYALQHVVPRSERSADVLFVDRAMHGPQLLDWTSLCAAESGYPGRAARLAEQALGGGMDAGDAARIRNNIHWFGRPRTAPYHGDVAQLIAWCERLRHEELHLVATVIADAATQLLPDDSPPPWQLDFEKSISAWYAPGRRRAAVNATNRVVARRDVPDDVRTTARGNRRYTVAALPSSVWQATPLRIAPDAVPTGYHPTNPSVMTDAEMVRVLVRTVNYRIRTDGGYDHPGHVDTRNLLGTLTGTDTVEGLQEIMVPEEFRADDALIRGFEDARLVARDQDGTLRLVANRSHPDDAQRRTMYALQVRLGTDGSPVVTAARQLHYGDEPRVEKNWMPVIGAKALTLVYSVDPTIVVRPNADGICETIAESVPPFWCADLRGGSQLVPVTLRGGGTGWIAIVHGLLTERPRRTYFHAFVLFDAGLSVVALSDPFVLRDQQIEFAAGCARVGDELLITWGENDGDPWIGRISIVDAIRLCLDGVVCRAAGDASSATATAAGQAI